MTMYSYDPTMTMKDCVHAILRDGNPKIDGNYLTSSDGEWRISWKQLLVLAGEVGSK